MYYYDIKYGFVYNINYNEMHTLKYRDYNDTFQYEINHVSAI